MIDHVLVALDGSARAPGVFAAAADIALHFGALLHPFRAIFVPPEFPAGAAGTRTDPLPEHLSRQAEGDLLRLVAHAHEVKLASPTVRVGQPWRAILDIGDELDVDLIVLGSHGYHGLESDSWHHCGARHESRAAQRSRRPRSRRHARPNGAVRKLAV